MQVKQIYNHNALKNFTYLLRDEISKHAYCIDPYDGGIAYTALSDLGWELKEIWNTHAHPDHIRGNEKLASLTGAKIMQNFMDEKRDFENGLYQKLTLAIPGHSMDHVGYLFLKNNKQEFFFCADTLFQAGVGHCRLGGDVATLYQTISELNEKIEDSTLLYTGHDYLINNLEFALTIDGDNQEIKKMLKKARTQDSFLLTNMAQERKINPFLRLFTDEFKEAFTIAEKNMNNESLFFHLRALRDNW